jgi:alpha-glucosidase
MTNPNRLWWQTGVFYIVYVRSFKDTTGDGVGDLAGVTEKLDYLSDTLGIDAIWIAAVYPSPMADFGYDVSHYTDILPLFGDLATFDELVAQAHRRGLKVIVDYIPNHSSDQHRWFVESRCSRDHPKRDWYIWVDPKPDGSPPNNWLSVFGGSAWEWDDATGQYYMHSFLREQPDLNWRNPALKEAMFDVARFWMERGVDGFRIDCAHHVIKDDELRDNPPNPKPADTAYKPLGEYDSQLHLYDRERPDVHPVWREFRHVLDGYSSGQPRAAFGEIHVFDWPEWVKYYGEQLDELHMPFNLGLVGIEWKVQAILNVVDGIEAALPPGAWPNYMLDNFDESRVATRYGQAAVRVAAMLLLTLRGTPTLCYGEEIGMTNVPIPPELEQDPFGLRVPGLGRDPYRTPMQWDAGPNAGFSAPDTPRLWLPLADDYREVNVERELADQTSILNLYRRLLAYRKASPALQWGDYQTLDDVPEGCYVYMRKANGHRTLIALNFIRAEQRIALRAMGTGKIAISTHLDREGAVDLAKLFLRGDEGVIIELE